MRCGFEGEAEFPQVGVSLFVLGPGEPVGMYHWEHDQEDFLVLDGEALLILEGEERPLGRWDFVHCPAGTNHIVVAAREHPCVVLAVGARENSTGPDWGGYRVDEVARRHGVGVERETSDVHEAYARFPSPGPRAIATGRCWATDASSAGAGDTAGRAQGRRVRCTRRAICGTVRARSASAIAPITCQRALVRLPAPPFSPRTLRRKPLPLLYTTPPPPETLLRGIRLDSSNIVLSAPTLANLVISTPRAVPLRLPVH